MRMIPDHRQSDQEPSDQERSDEEVPDSKARSCMDKTTSKKRRGSFRRIISAVVYNLSCFGHGCNVAWVGGAMGGGSWLAALPAAPFLALLADAKGRRAGALAICICFIMSGWLCTWSARGVWASRAAAGAAGAGALALAPVYCAEIAPGNKGLAVMPALATSCGVLFAYAAGPVLSAQVLPLWMALPSVVLMLSLIWLPETPSFLISVGRIQDAAKVICWLNGSDFREDLTDIIEEQEVRIRTNDCYGSDPARAEDDIFQPMLQRSGLDVTSDRKGDTSACRELFFQRRNRRSLFSLCVVLCVAAGSGAGAVGSFGAGSLGSSASHTPLAILALQHPDDYMNYNNNSTSHISWYLWAAGPLLCSAALVLGAVIALSTLDRLGTKVLLLSSCSGLAFSLAVFGVYCDPRVPLPWTHFTFVPRARSNSALIYNDSVTLKEFQNNTRYLSETVLEDNSSLNQRLMQNHTFEINRFSIQHLKDDDDDFLSPPTFLLSLVLFLYNLGLGSVPYVSISELFTAKARSIASSFLVSWMWMINFLLLRYCGRAVTILGLHGTYYFSAIVTLLGSLYIYLTIPETKGKSQEQIDEILRGSFCLFRNKSKKEEELPCFELNCYTNSA